MSNNPETYTIDSVPVSGLTDRYQIGRTALYDRLKALGIEPEKRGRSSHVSHSQLGHLDELDTRLKAGESMPKPPTEHSANMTAEHSPNIHRTYPPYIHRTRSDPYPLALMPRYSPSPRC